MPVIVLLTLILSLSVINFYRFSLLLCSTNVINTSQNYTHKGEKIIWVNIRHLRQEDNHTKFKQITHYFWLTGNSTQYKLREIMTELRFGIILCY